MACGEQAPSLDHMYWTCVHDSGFPSKSNHAVATHRDEEGNWYVFSFGGVHVDVETLLSQPRLAYYSESTPVDIYVCDIASRSWTAVDPPSNQCFNTEPMKRVKVPPRRHSHTVCSYKGRVYMYGGTNSEDGIFSDVECYDIKHNIWLKLHCSGDLPGRRMGHACTTRGATMFLQGGYDGNGLVEDTFAFDMETYTWRKVYCHDSQIPARDFHTTTALEGTEDTTLIVFGGRIKYGNNFDTHFSPMDDIYGHTFYSLNVDWGHWQPLQVTGYRPVGRRSHSAVGMGTEVLFMGGYDGASREHLRDVFILDTKTQHVTEVCTFGSGPAPFRRTGCARVGSEVMICGGTRPTEVDYKWKKEKIPLDISDVYILHLIPTLQQLSQLSVVQLRLPFHFLPSFIRSGIQKLLDVEVKHHGCRGKDHHDPPHSTET